MKLSELNDAIHIAEQCMEQYCKAKNLAQTKYVVAVKDGIAAIIEDKDISRIEDDNGFVFDVVYKNPIATAKLRTDLSEKKGSNTSIYFDADNLAFLDNLANKTGKTRSAVVSEIIAEFRKK